LLARQRRRLVLPFLAPAATIYGIFLLWPTLQAFVTAFTDWKGVTLDKSFNGLGNFEHLARDPLFFKTLGTTVALVLVGGVILFPLALTLAFATSERIRGRHLFRFVVLAPLAVSVVAAAVLWKFVYDPNLGLLNGVLRAVGLRDLSMPWLGQPETALIAIAIVIVWQNVGIFVVFLSAAIANVPSDLKEAAQIDGGSALQVFRHVTFPLIWEVTRILMILWIVSGLQEFVFVWAMTKGGPLNSTETVGIFVYMTAFQGKAWAYATAAGVVMFLLMVAISLFFYRVTRRDVVQY